MIRIASLRHTQISFGNFARCSSCGHHATTRLLSAAPNAIEAPQTIELCDTCLGRLERMLDARVRKANVRKLTRAK